MAVIGAGVAGLLIADALDRDGHQVSVLDARGVGEGVSGSSTAKVTALHAATYADLERRRGPEAARTYATANQQGVEDIGALIEREGIDCGWRRLPSSTYTVEPGRIGDVRAEADAARRDGLDVTFTGGSDLPYRIAGAVVCADQGMVDPHRFLQGLARSLHARGVNIHEGSRVVAVLDEPDGRRSVATAEGGRLTARAVVVATDGELDRCGSIVGRTVLYGVFDETGQDGVEMLGADRDGRLFGQRLQRDANPGLLVARNHGGEDFVYAARTTGG